MRSRGPEPCSPPAGWAHPRRHQQDGRRRALRRAARVRRGGLEPAGGALRAARAEAGRRATGAQAEVPRGATVLPNRWGTAPGLWLEGTPGLVIMLPGVPRRDAEAAGARGRAAAGRPEPRLGDSLARWSVPPAFPESTLAERMGEIEREIAPLTLAYLPGLDGVDLRLSAWDLAPDEAERAAPAGAALFANARGRECVRRGERTIWRRMVLDGRARTDSGSGRPSRAPAAWSGARLTEIPGSSDVFVGRRGRLRQRAQDGRCWAWTSPARSGRRGERAVARAMAEGAVRALRRGCSPWR